MIKYLLTPDEAQLEEQKESFDHGDPLDMASNDELAKRLKQCRQETKLSQKAVGEYINAKQYTVAKYENGKSRPNSTDLKILSEIFNVNLEWLAFGIGGRDARINIIGEVSAGASDRVAAFDDSETAGNLETIEPDFAVKAGTVAVVVRGESMKPHYNDGDILLYKRDQEFSASQCVGKRCIVRTEDGEVYIKTVRRDKNKTTFSLISSNQPIMEGVKLQWAAPITAAVYR